MPPPSPSAPLPPRCPAPPMAWLPVNVLFLIVAVPPRPLSSPPPTPCAGEGAARVAGAADGLVVGEGAVADGQASGKEEAGNRAAATSADEDDAAAARVAAAAQGLVVVERAVRDRGPALSTDGPADTLADALPLSRRWRSEPPIGLVVRERASAQRQGATSSFAPRRQWQRPRRGDRRPCCRCRRCRRSAWLPVNVLFSTVR